MLTTALYGPTELHVLGLSLTEAALLLLLYTQRFILTRPLHLALATS